MVRSDVAPLAFICSMTGSTLAANCVARSPQVILLLRSASLVGMAPLPRVTEQPVATRGTASALRCGRRALGAGRDYLMMMSKSRLSQPERHGEREHHDGQSSQHSQHGIFPPQIRFNWLHGAPNSPDGTK
jgi:hypothetical protein